MGKKSNAKARHRLFNQAWSKAIAILPGGENTLSPREEAELRKYLYGKRQNDGDV